MILAGSSSGIGVHGKPRDTHFTFLHYEHFEAFFEGNLSRENIGTVFHPFKQKTVMNSENTGRKQDIKGVKRKLLNVEAVKFL